MGSFLLDTCKKHEYEWGATVITGKKQDYCQLEYKRHVIYITIHFKWHVTVSSLFTSDFLLYCLCVITASWSVITGEKFRKKNFQ